MRIEEKKNGGKIIQILGQTKTITLFRDFYMKTIPWQRFFGGKVLRKGKRKRKRLF